MHTRSFIAFLLLLLPAAPSAAFAYESLLRELRDPTTLTLEVVPTETADSVSPGAVAVPRGATGVRLLSLRLKADCDGGITVNEIRAHHIGPGAIGDIQRVYLLERFRRLTPAVRFSSSDHMALLRPRSLGIPACQSVVVDVAADYATSAAVGGRSAVEILSLSDIATDAEKIEADFPLRMKAARGPGVTPESSGQVTVTFLPLSGKVSTTVDEELAHFLIEADDISHQLLYGITLKNSGTARGDDLRNLYLTRQGRPLTQVANRMDGDTVTLEFSQPHFLRRGQRETFSLRGRAFTGDRTIAFTLEEPTDLRAFGTKRRGRTLGR